MAQLKDLIVNGASRLLGKLYVNNGADIHNGLNAPEGMVYKAETTSTSDTNGRWTVSIPNVTSLYDGLTIRIILSKSYDSTQCSGWFNTLNVNGLGEKMVWHRYNTRLTSHIPQYSIVDLTYRTSAGSTTVACNFYPLTGTNKGAWAASTAYVVNDYVTYSSKTYRCKTAHTSGTSWSETNWIQVYTPTSTIATNSTGNTTITDGWICNTVYDSGNPGDYNHRPYYARYYTGANPLYAYKLCALDNNGKMQPLVLTSGNGTTKDAITVAFKPHKIYYYSGSTTISANSLIGHANIWSSRYLDNTCTYNFNETITTYQDVYLIGTLSSTTGLFTLDTTSKTSWYKQVPANQASITLSSYFTSGKYYIYLGRTYNSNNYMYLLEDNPVYYFDGTNLVQTISRAESVNGYTVNANVPSGAKFTDTTYSAATTSAAGLMSAADKTKLDGIAISANNYSHPTSSGNKHIPSGGSSGQILRWSADGTAAWDSDNNTTYSNFVKSGTGAAAGLVPAPSTTAGTTKYLREDGTWQVPPDNNTTYSAATTSAQGLMSVSDKTKLDSFGATIDETSFKSALNTKLQSIVK